MQEDPKRVADRGKGAPTGSEPSGSAVSERAAIVLKLRELFPIAHERYCDSDPAAMNTLFRTYADFLRSNGIDPERVPEAIPKLQRLLESGPVALTLDVSGRDRTPIRARAASAKTDPLIERVLEQARRSEALAAKIDSFTHFAEVVKKLRPALGDALQVARAEKGADIRSTYPLHQFDGLYLEQVVRLKKSPPCLEALVVVNLKIPVVIHLSLLLDEKGEKMAKGEVPLLTLLTTQGNLIATYKISPKKIEKEQKDKLVAALKESISREEDEPFSHSKLKTFLVRHGWKQDISGLLFPESVEQHPKGYEVVRKGKGEPWAIPLWGKTTVVEKG